MTDAIRRFNPLRSQIVLIGTGYYDADVGLHPLPAVHNNISELHSIFNNASLGAMPEGACAAIVDPRHPRDIGLALRAAARRAEDLLLIYYAGHGLVDRYGELHLALSNTTTEVLSFTAVPYQWIRESMADSDARNKVAIVDCCFSGRAVSAQSEIASLVAGQLDIEGTYTLTSSPRNEPARAPLGEKYTAFSGELIRLLQYGIPGGPEMLTLDSIYEEMRQIMRRRGLPIPEAGGTRTTGKLGLLPNKASDDAFIAGEALSAENFLTESQEKSAKSSSAGTPMAAGNLPSTYRSRLIPTTTKAGVALIFGLIAAVMFSSGTRSGMITGGLVLLLSAVGQQIAFRNNFPQSAGWRITEWFRDFLVFLGAAIGYSAGVNSGFPGPDDILLLGSIVATLVAVRHIRNTYLPLKLFVFPWHSVGLAVIAAFTNARMAFLALIFLEVLANIYVGWKYVKPKKDDDKPRSIMELSQVESQCGVFRSDQDTYFS